MKEEIAQLKKSYADWDEKFKAQSVTFEKEKKQLDEKTQAITRKRADLEKYIEKMSEEMN